VNPGSPSQPADDALGALLRGLEAAECAFTATDVADALWLFSRVEGLTAGPPEPPPEPVPLNDGDAPAPVRVEPAPAPPPPEPLRPVLRKQKIGRRPVRPQPAGVSVPGGDTEPSGVRMNVPSHSALADPRAVVGALRPLLTRRRSRGRVELDVEATIRRRGEEGNFSLVFSPALDRWLDVSVVIDSSLSMQVWEPTLRDLRRVFETLGAFRQTRTWHLATDGEKPSLHPARRGQPHAGGASAGTGRRPGDVLGTPGATLVLVVTDCVSEAWYGEALARWLNDWARAASVAIVNVLPPRMWQRTAAGDFRTGTLRREGGGFGGRTAWEPDWPTAEHRGQPVRPIPMTVLELSELASFVKFVAGRGVGRARGVVIVPAPPQQAAEQSEKTPARRPDAQDVQPTVASPPESDGVRAVRAFQNRASAPAQRLAARLAAAPVINLDVIRLLADRLPPPGAAGNEGYRPEHIAEVWLGGFLRPDEAAPVGDPAKSRYTIPDDARNALFAALPYREAVRVLECVAQHRAAQGDTADGLWAFLRNRDSTGQRLRRGDPIAEVTADILKRLGGEYARFAQDEADPYAGADPDFEMPDDVLTPVEHAPEEAALEEIEKLHAAVRKWIENSVAAQKNQHLRQNLPFVDLYFGFAFGIYQDRVRAEKLVEDARKVMVVPIPAGGSPQADQAVTAAVASNTLFQAFQYRVEQALAGNRHTGPLSPTVRAALDDLSRKAGGGPVNNPYKLADYVVTSMRNRSHVVEPEERPDPYSDWTKHGDPLKKELAALRAIREPRKLADSIRKLHKEGVSGKPLREVQFYALHEGLPLAPRVGEGFTAEMVQLVPAALAHGTGAATESPDLPKKQGELLERALFLAGHYDRVDLTRRLVDSFLALLPGKTEETRFKLINVVAGQCLRSLWKLGLRDEVDRFFTSLQTQAFRGATMADVKKRYASKPEMWSAVLQTLLRIASGWLSVGLADRAEPILTEARNELLGGTGTAFQPKDYTELAQAYVAALGQGPAEAGVAGIAELFRKMDPKKITNTWTTAQYYSRFHLQLVEDAVFAVCQMFR
jgi:hypothetical protein